MCPSLPGIGNLLLEEISERFNQTFIPEDIAEKIEFGDSFAELLDKFIIMHIRAWKLEDEIGQAIRNNDINRIVDLKKKLDIVFKIKRPKLIKAINCFIALGKFEQDEDIKFYNGYHK